MPKSLTFFGRVKDLAQISDRDWKPLKLKEIEDKKMALKIDVPSSNEWHVLKGEVQYGPYSYEEMIQMLQNKTLYGFDYTWAPHLDQWTPLAELTEFSADRLHRLAEKASDSSVFQRRQHPRVLVQLPILVHDQKKIWPGVCENLSSGGALVLMENPLLLPGDIVTLHFRAPRSQEKSFNTTAEILTKRLTKQKIQHDTRLHYALKFLTLHPQG
jgi:hypothetical protein